MTRGIVFTLIAALAVFCVVQDKVTAGGARRYVRIQREAMAAHGSPAVTVDEIMAPAIRAGVRDGLLSAGAVMGIGAGFIVYGRQSRRSSSRKRKKER